MVLIPRFYSICLFSPLPPHPDFFPKASYWPCHQTGVHNEKLYTCTYRGIFFGVGGGWAFINLPERVKKPHLKFALIHSARCYVFSLHALPSALHLKRLTRLAKCWEQIVYEDQDALCFPSELVHLKLTTSMQLPQSLVSLWNRYLSADEVCLVFLEMKK